MQKSRKKTSKKLLRDHAIDAANRIAAQDITAISDRKRLAVRRVLRRSTAEGWTKTHTKERLSELIGLDDRQANALINYRGMLERQYPGQKGKISRMVKEQAAKYRKKRVQRIANTELASIKNQARRDRWATDYPGRLREWIVVDPCPICKPMTGQMAEVGEPYWNGMIGPPVHPNCKCHERLI